MAWAVNDLMEVLLLLGTRADVALASSLQRAMDEYSVVVQSNPAPVAPEYPPEWLVRKSMASVFRFQNITAIAAEPRNDTSSKIGNVVGWWQVAADGIQTWRAMKKTSLT